MSLSPFTAAALALARLPLSSLALPDYDPFNYAAAANLIGQTSPDGLTWVAAGAGATQITIASGSLSYFGLAPSSGNSIQIPATANLSARMPVGFTVSSGTMYYSFLLKVVDLTGLSTTGSHFAGFNNSVGSQTQIPTAIGTRVLLRASGSGAFNIGVSKASATITDWTWSPSVFETNTTVFLVGSYTINSSSTSDDVARLWINPDPADFGTTNPVSTPLVATTGADIPANQIASFVFFQRTGGVQPALTLADELRIGRTFADVTPTNTVGQVCAYPVCPGSRGIVQCLQFTNKGYDIYLPPAYSTTNPLPILYTFHPNSNGMVGNFGAVASDLEMIVVGVRESNNNLEWYDFIDAVYAITRDIRQRVAFDPTAEFTAGWSGGGYESYNHSQILRQQIAGVYPMCGWVPRYDATDRYLTNLLVARANALQDNPGLLADWAPDGTYLDTQGAVRRDTWFPGPHAIAPDTNKLDCLQWLLDHRVKPAPDAQAQALARAAQWRAALTQGQVAEVFADCFATLFLKPRTYEELQAQLIIDEIQTNCAQFRLLNVTNLWPGDLAADYLYYRAFGAAKIGDTNTYFSCLKAATWLTGDSGDRWSDLYDLMSSYGIPRPQAGLRVSNGQVTLTFRKDAPQTDYEIQRSTNALPGSWTPVTALQTDNPDGTCSATFQDSSSCAFFRLAAALQ